MSKAAGISRFSLMTLSYTCPGLPGDAEVNVTTFPSGPRKASGYFRMRLFAYSMLASERRCDLFAMAHVVVSIANAFMMEDTALPRPPRNQ